MSTINCKQYPKVFIYIYHILYFCIPLLYPRAATSSAKNCPSDLTSKGYLRLLGSASTQSGFTGLFLTYPASALSPRPTCLADPMLLQFFSHLRRSYPAERRPCLPTGRRTTPPGHGAAAWCHRRCCLAPSTPPLGATNAAVPWLRLLHLGFAMCPTSPSNGAPPPPSFRLCQPDVSPPP